MILAVTILSDTFRPVTVTRLIARIPADIHGLGHETLLLPREHLLLMVQEEGHYHFLNLHQGNKEKEL